MEISFYFKSVVDYRVEGRCLHLLSDILGLILVGSLAGCDDYLEILDYAADNQRELEEKLGFKFPNGLPSEDTLERVIRYLDSKEVENAMKDCLSGLSLQGRHICIDGKALRGTIPSGKRKALVHLVNAWVDEFGLSFGQEQVDKKSNEITAIPKLLDRIACQGSVITMDAMGCQKEIIELIADKQADYVIALKANQKGLYQEAVQFIEAHLEILPSHKSSNNGHGRQEERTVYLLNDISLCQKALEWKNAASLVMIDRVRYLSKGKIERKRQYYISSLKDLDPQEYGQYMRGHWAIENGLHWQLDFTFKEDHSQVRKDNAPANLHLIRKWALHLFKKDPQKISIKRKRKKAGRNVEYILELFNR